jgi:hypothetical protein
VSSTDLREFPAGVFFADSLASITGGKGISGNTGFVAGYTRKLKVVQATDDTTIAIPYANGSLKSVLWLIKAIGGAAGTGTTTVGLWLQGSHKPLPAKGVSWVNVCLIDSINANTYNTEAARYSLAPVDSVTQRYSFVRFRINGASSAGDTSQHVIIPYIEYRSVAKQ